MDVDLPPGMAVNSRRYFRPHAPDPVLVPAYPLPIATPSVGQRNVGRPGAVPTCVI
jgi:hypothetical protein